MARVSWTEARRAVWRGACLAVALAWPAQHGCFAHEAGAAALPSPVVRHSAGTVPAAGPPTPALIPLPAEIVPAEGAFQIGPETLVRVPSGDREARDAARYLVDLIARTRGLKLAIREGRSGSPAITFVRQPGFAAEGYRLEVHPGGVRLAASTGAGLFYGAITLWQLLPASQGAGEVPAQVIRDAPVHAWRGLMLDSARHFQSPQFVKSMLDWMALHKLNVLHWHLTDDQGWRIQIRRYPRLTSVGAWRTPATVSAPGAPRPPGYGGYYTQAEIRDIVAYAASRHIQIVPEIEMPGHAQAAIAAYPELGSTSGAAPGVSSRWGVHSDLFNLDPATFTFLENVLEEVMALFPSPFVHIGGDEVAKDEWEHSPAVQARARALGLDEPEALQAWFTQQIGRFLTRHGRRLVGWDEILQPGLSRDAIVMSWRGTAGAHAAAIAGNDTVLSPWPDLYFDNRQSALPSEPPGRMRVISLEDVYRFDPRDPSLTEEQRRHVIGVQANLWTEHIRTEERLEWMALPRAAALAEVAWTAPERRSWPDFLQRLVPTFAKYRALGLHFADSAFAVETTLSREPEGIRATLTNQARFGEIHYTVDGTEPSAASPKYSTPLDLPLGTELRAATFAAGARVSRVWQRRLDEATLSRRSSRELDLCSDGILLLLEPKAFGSGQRPIFALDIMNPCWIYHGADLSGGARLLAAVGQLPFNFEIGADVKKIRVGDARTPHGELEVRIDGCEGDPQAVVALEPVPADALETTLTPVDLPARPGRHDICLRFARPQLDPMWALDWVEITR